MKKVVSVYDFNCTFRQNQNNPTIYEASVFAELVTEDWLIQPWLIGEIAGNDETQTYQYYCNFGQFERGQAPTFIQALECVKKAFEQYLKEEPLWVK